MANIEKLVPFIIKWETGTTQKRGETAEQLFERARKKGFANDPMDLGGATQTGVTLATYKTYCRKHGQNDPTVDDLKQIPYQTWLAILKELYWDRWKADQIDSQSVANILVDFVWASGTTGIKKPQQMLGVVPDGVVGPKTLAAVNSYGPTTLFYRLKALRIKYVEDIVKSRPSQKKWLKGWKNRINDIQFNG